MSIPFRTVLAFVLLLAGVGPTFAQGGGASSTGTIQGKVSDSQGGVLPGVTVTATSPALISQQTTVTSETGNYRFPGLPPGTYTLTYELPGFNTVKREGIQISLGFTASVNVELSVATLQETVTVTGESPVIDTTATRVQQNFKLQQLESIPNARDMWALLAATPGVAMSRIDVGGNRAGTQTSYTAYGLNGQVRVLVEGINTTEGTSGAGFYFDYGSFEEVFVGTAGQSAEMPTPGVLTQFLGKSGGNTFSGQVYFDWYNDSMQGSNLSDEQINRFGLRPGSNELKQYRDFNVNAGGPIKKDKAWWHLAWRDQFNSVDQPQFLFPAEFETRNWNPSAKVTYQVSQRNKLIGYYQWNKKEQPTRLPLGSYVYDNVGETVSQGSPSWVWKGEWNGTLSDKLYVEARYGDFGYYDPRLANGDEDYFWRDSGNQTLTGSYGSNQLDRDRKQMTAAATYFIDTGKGSHTLKFGGEMYFETQWGGTLESVGGNIEHVYANGRSSTVTFAIPTALHVGSMRDNDRGNLLVVNKLNQQDLFLNDTWALGRLTLSLGVRWDRYVGFMPEQRQLAFTNGPVSVPEVTFPEQTFFTWNSVVPRIGAIYDLSGDGRTVIKASWGLFRHNPGPAVSADANPNQNDKTVTYTWDDKNGDRRYQLGEEGQITSNQLAGALGIDPDIKQPYSHDASIYLERQFTDTIGARVGFIYKTEDDLIGAFVPGRSTLNDAYSVAFPFTDIGPDGISGTGDDRVLTLYGVPTSRQDEFPLTRVEMNIPGRLSRYKTIESSVTKRLSNRWSAQLGGAYTWLHDYPDTLSSVPNAQPQTPNSPGAQDRTRWDFKLSASYEGPWGLNVSPLLRHQAGINFGRTISVGSSTAAAFGAIFSGTIYAEPADTRRQDNITVLDVRVDRTFSLTPRIKIRGFLDLFNITNSNAVETRTVSTGSRFLYPTAVLPPRAARIGFRFLW